MSTVVWSRIGAFVNKYMYRAPISAVASAADSVLSERAMRGSMSCLYAAMVLSNSNTKAVSDGKIPLAEREPEGNPTAVECMKKLDRWIHDLTMFVEQSYFENMFLLPMRKSAEFLQWLRARPRRSTDVKGFVFAVSEPSHDDVEGRDLRTVSAIIPSLETAMYVRVDRWDAAETGWYLFENVQPIPLINRMCPTKKLAAKPAPRPKTGLARMPFLNCPLSGAKDFSRSVAMENFCEIHSRQSEKKHELGAPLILHGRVSSMDANRIDIAGCGSKESFLSAYLAQGVGTTFAKERMEGKYVRVLAVVWYRSDADAKSAIEPEVYALEETDLEGAVAGEVEGLVRIHGPASADEIRHRYGRMPESRLLVEREGRIHYRRATGSENDIHAQFTRTVCGIRDARREADSSIHSFPAKEDGVRITEQHIASGLRPSEMRSVLFFIIESADHGNNPTEKEIQGRFQNPARITRRLELLGLINRKEDMLAVSEAGRKNGYKYGSKDIGLLVGAPPNVVFLPELEASGVPPSFVYKYLKESGYRSIVADGLSHKICLRRDGATEAEINDCASKAVDLGKKVLDVFNTVSHPLPLAYLSEKLSDPGYAVPPVYAGMILETMKNDGQVEYDGNGSWRVPTECKIKHVFSTNPESILTQTEIMRRATIPGLREGEVKAALNRLVGEGLASEILVGKWSLSDGEDEKRLRELGAKVEHFAKTLLKRRSMERSMFLTRLRQRLDELVPPTVFRKGSLASRAALHRAATSAADRLVADGIMEEQDGMYRLK